MRDVVHEMSYKLSFFLQVIGILPAVLMFFFLSRLMDNVAVEPLLSYGGNYFPFVLVGIAFQNYLTVSMNHFSGRLRESQMTGTLEAVLVTPIGLTHFLFGSVIYSYIFNSLRIVLYLLAGTLIFGVVYDWGNIPLALLALLSTIVAFSSLGIFAASFIMIFKRGDPVNWSFSVLSWLLGGVYYPISVLPDWLQKASMWVPMTHALESVRQVLILGAGFAAVWDHILILLLWGLIGLPLSLLCFSYAVKRAKMMGTLGHY